MKIALSLFLVCLGFIVAHEGHEHVARKLGGGSRETMIQRECWTREPEEPDFEARRRARSFANFRREQGAESSDLASLDTRIIPVCFHNPGGVRLPLLNRLSLWNERMLTNEQLQRELDHLNEAFTASSCCDESLPWCDGQCSVDIPIKFVMARVDSDDNIIGTTDTTSDSDACITRPQGLRWMRMAVLGFSEARIKSALRVGDASTLNIYFIRSSLAPLGRTQLLGFATFPWSYSRRPKLDGVVVEPASVGGGSFERFDEGDTLVHEVGHWLGLFHTFQGGCRRGDDISDTPAEGSPYSGCAPEQERDTCPRDPGTDPIHNFMDYSDDVCMFRFTAEQATVMVENFDAYRSGEGANSLVKEFITQLDAGIASVSQSLSKGGMKVFALNVPEPGKVKCGLTRGEGNLELLMNWDGLLENFDCREESDAAQKACMVGPDSGTAYAIVYASAATADFSITCDVVL